MALNDTFTIQDVNLDKKKFLCDIEPKRLKSFPICRHRIRSMGNYQIIKNVWLKLFLLINN